VTATEIAEQSSGIASLKGLGLWPEREQRQNLIVATYDYTDENGTMLYRGAKEFQAAPSEWLRRLDLEEASATSPLPPSRGARKPNRLRGGR